MKRHSLLVFLVVAILWIGSLAVVGYVVAPDIALDQNPQTKDYNSSKSNTTSIKIGLDGEGYPWIGLVHLTKDGNVQVGTHGGNMVEIEVTEFGNIIVGELKRSPEFDGLILEALDEALSVWTGAQDETDEELRTRAK
jgi:hypothetical protein